MRRESSPSLVLMGLALVGVLAALRLEGLSLLWLRLTAVALGAAAVVAGLLWHRPRRPRPWLLLAAGLLASTTGQAVRLATATGAPGPSDSLAVTGWIMLGGVLVLVAAVLATVQVRGPDPGSAVDASLVAVALWMVIWQWVVPARAEAMSAGGEVTGGLNLLLFVVFAAVFGLLVQTLRTVPAGDRAALALLSLGVLGAIGGFVMDVAQQGATSAVGFDGLRAALAVVANTAPGAAALHPTMRAVDERRATAEDDFTLPRLVGFGIALLVPPAVLSGAHLRGDQIGLLGLAMLWMLLATGILARTTLLLSARRAAQSQVEASERRMRSLVAHTGDLLLVVELGDRRRIRYASPAALRVLGRPAEHLVSTCALELPVEDAADYREVLLGADPLPRRADVRMRHLDGSIRWIEVVVDHYDDVDGPALVLALDDITERKDSEMHWVEVAHRDPLTGLLNRRGLEQRLEQALEASTSSGGRVGLLLGDLDGFKQINDSAGHPVGDEVLKHVAARLQRVVRGEDAVGRLGGDEFVVLVPLDGEGSALRLVAERVAATLATPVIAGGGSWPVGISLGAAIADGDDPSATHLLRRADVALYRAKAAGKGRVVWDDEVTVT